MTGIRFTHFFLIFCLGRRAEERTAQNDILQASNNVKNTIEEATVIINHWADKWRTELWKLQDEVSKTSIYLNDIDSSYRHRFIWSINKINDFHEVFAEVMDREIGNRTDLFFKKMKENIINKVEEPATNLEVLQKKFMNITDRAAKVNDGLKPLAQYLGYKHLISRSVTKYIKQKVLDLAIENKDLFKPWIYSYIKSTENKEEDCYKDMWKKKFDLESKRHLPGIYQITEKYKMELEKCYSIMKAKYINSSFIAQLKDIVSYGKNELKRDNITLSTEIIEKFIVEINRSNKIETGELTKLLKESLSNIEEELECLKQKLNTVFTMFDGCATGSVNSTILFLVAQNLDEIYSKRCGNGISLPKCEMYSVNNIIMKIRGRRKECMRNSEAFQELACSLWSNNNTIIEIAEQMPMVTLADANYFVSQC